MRLRDKKIEYDDLYQEAMIGLNYAIDHFKEQKKQYLLFVCSIMY